MPAMMHAVQINGPGQARWIETPLPAVAASEVLVKVEAVTTCPQWDLHLLAGEPMFPGGTLAYPLPAGQPGHEMAGEIAAIGPQATTFQPGDKVAAWCDPGKIRGGCYAQFVSFAETHLLPLPPGLSARQAASLELAMCVQVSFNQLNACGAIADQRVVISGAGPAGLIAVQMARIYGAKEILALEPLAARRQLAIAAGADAALEPEAVQDRPAADRPAGWNTGVDCTGLAPSVRALLSLCQDYVHVFGVLRQEVAFGFAEWRKGLALIGYGNHSRAAAEQALAWMLSGRLDLSLLSTHTLPLREYLRGIALLRAREAVKIRYLPWT